MTHNSYILTLETSSHICGAALSNNGDLVAEYSFFDGNKHDKLITEYIRRLLGDASVKVEELSAVAVNAGPGSFTGLRIGAAAAKAICFGGNPKMIAVPALSALAFASIDYLSLISNKNQIRAVIPSHKDVIYYQDFDCNGIAKGDIQINTKELMNDIADDVLLCGPLTNINPRITAGMIAKKAFNLFQAEEFCDAEMFTPLYVQEFEPKIKQVK